ncbi:hypothetical protein V5799_008818 [Amblyomma americanum]|uniref:M13 family peptidase n=1 Tax=Amblyomma americanum TaxID=6943 RepID=A0AAQ4FDW8_AMBAM
MALSTVTSKLKLRLKIISCAFAAAVIVALALWAIVTAASPSPRASSHVCKTHACLAYSVKLLSSINESLNPCESFMHFVCDGWRRKNHHSVWMDLFRPVLERLTNTLKNIDVPASAQNQEQRAAIVYRSCVSVLEGTRDELPAVKDALASAGVVWPHRSVGANVLRTLLYCALKLGWDVLLDFEILSNGKTVELVASRGELLQFVLEKRMHKNYFEFLRQSFRIDSRPTVTYEETSDFGIPALRKLQDVTFETSSTLKVVNFPTEPDVGLTEAQWQETVTKLNISTADNASLKTAMPNYLRSVLGLWRQNGSDSFHMFASWCTVQVAALFANRDLVLNYYDHDRSFAQIFHRMFCVTRAMFFSRDAPFARYNADVRQGNALSAAKDVALSVRSAFFRRLSNWAQFDDNITVVGNWSSLTLSFRNIEHREVDATEFRGQLPEMTDSFVWNWQHSVLVRNQAELIELLDFMYRLWYWRLSKTDLELMPYALSFPFFDYELPSSVNYGGFGAENAIALGLLFLHAYRTKDATKFETIMKCFQGDPSAYGDERLVGPANVVGYRALVDAYESGGRALDRAVIGLEKYTGLQQLFISLCYVSCKGGSADRNSSMGCDLPLRHVPQFAAAFHCDVGDPMNPTKQCDFP